MNTDLISHWRTLFAKAAAELQRTNETVASLKQALSESISARDSLNADNTDLRAKVDSQIHTINSLDADLRETATQLESVSKIADTNWRFSLDECAKRVEAESLLKALRTQNAEYFSEIRSALSEIRSALSETQKAVEARDAALRANGELTKENAHLSSSYDALSKLYSDLLEDMKDLNFKANCAGAYLRTNVELGDSNRDLLAENGQLSNRIGQLETSNKALSSLVDGARTSFKWHMGILTDMAAARTPRELADVSATSSDPDFSAAMSAVREAVTAFFDAQDRIAELEQTACGRVTALESRVAELTKLNGDLHIEADRLERQVIDLDMVKQQYERIVADLAPLQPARNADEWGARISQVAMRRIAELETQLYLLRHAACNNVYYRLPSQELLELEARNADLRAKLHEAGKLGHQIEQLNAQTT